MKTPRNGWYQSSVLAAIQAPTVEVRDHKGGLLAMIERSQAAVLLMRGWAEPVGNRTVKYLRLTPKAPLRASTGGSWLGGSCTTRPMRADQTCKLFGDGQLMGARRSHREHKPLA
jgi:hypothetical protein